MHDKKSILSPEAFKNQIVKRVGHEKLFSWANEKGIKRWVIETIEKGKIPEKHEHLVALAQALDVSLDWLLTGEAQAVNAEGIIPFQSPEEREYLEKLLEVLRNPNTKRAIQENIDTFLKVPRPEVDPLSVKKKGVVNHS